MYIKKLFTIGQFAALHEINKKTLMWYDEIGLLKPAMVKQNGYRYYTYQQSSVLETILLLREMDVSLPEIQEFINHRSAAGLENLLNEKIIKLDDTISRLQAVRQKLEARRQEMNTLIHIDLSEISIVNKEKSYLAAVHKRPDVSLENEIEKVIAEAKKYQLRRLHDASYGAMISVESLFSGKFNDYSALYIELPNPAQKKGLHIQPKGTYLRAFHKGSKDTIAVRYVAMLNYALKNNLQLCGYAYEIGINEMVMDTINNHITKIEIPIFES